MLCRLKTQLGPLSFNALSDLKKLGLNNLEMVIMLAMPTAIINFSTVLLSMSSTATHAAGK